jgi:branched-chain amino acid transport system permease protein
MKRFDRGTLLFFGVLLGFILIVQALISLDLLGDFWVTLLRLGAVMAIVTIGLNLIYGYNGQFSLGQWGFYAIGAYTAADITYRWSNDQSASGLVIVFLAVLFVGGSFWISSKLVTRARGLDALSAFFLYLVLVIIAVIIAGMISKFLINPISSFLLILPDWLSMQIVFFLAVLLAGVLSAEVSYIFGLPVLTLGSDYFGIATLGLTIIVKVLLDNSDTMFGLIEMKGARGMIGIPKIGSWLWIGFFLVLVIVVTRNLLHSSQGRAIVSVREDELAAKAMGIDVAQQKILAFVLGSLYAGLAGGLYAHINGFLHPNTFNFIKSFDPLIIVVLGGLGSISGSVIASFAWALVLEGVLRLVLPQGFETWRFVVYPLLLLIMMLLRPSGLMGGFEFPYLKQILPALPKALQKSKAEASSVEETTAGD